MKKYTAILIGIIIIFSLILIACPTTEDPDDPEDVVTIKVINIPSQLNHVTGAPKTTYKLYIQLSDNMNSSSGHKAAGRSAGISTGLPGTIGGIQLYRAGAVNTHEEYEQNGNPVWKGRSKYVSVVLVPDTLNNYKDFQMYGFQKLPDGPEAVLDISKGILLQVGGTFAPPVSDFELLYKCTIAHDPDTADKPTAAWPAVGP